MKKSVLWRGSFYLLGMLILAFGITLNSRTGLGVSPIISLAYWFYALTGIPFSDATLLLYCLLAVVQAVIHLITRERKRAASDLLQLVVSVIFTRFMSVYTLLLPDFTTLEGVWGSLPVRLLLLIPAIGCTGIGAAMTLDMRLIPNPGDGIIQTLADLTGKRTGTVKNIFDLSMVCLTLLCGLLSLHCFTASLRWFRQSFI